MLRANILRTLAHRYPLYSGYGRIANLSLFRHATGNDPAPRWAELKAGPKILTPLDDWVGRALFYFGDLDPKLSWICERILRPGDTMLDVGANIGVMSLIGRQLVGPTGTVHAFEPQPNLVKLLRESIIENCYTNLHIHQCALGSEDAMLDLTIPDSNLGAASLARPLTEYKRTIKLPVAVHQTSAYLSSLGLSHIRLIKMDVEGYEPEVIRGALPYFRDNLPDTIVFELNDHSVPFFEQPVVKLLQSIAYSFLSVPKALWRMHVKPITSHDQSYEHDIIAVAKGPDYEDVMCRLGHTANGIESRAADRKINA